MIYFLDAKGSKAGKSKYEVTIHRASYKRRNPLQRNGDPDTAWNSKISALVTFP